jgi:EmrB/QacA subfamily drug resistance transporter
MSGPNARWWVLGTMTGAMSMLMIDQTVVSVALPSIQRDLGVSTAGVQWIVNAYLLALAMLVALGGRLSDLLGRERAFRVGAATFVVASAACGLAGGEAGIVAARALQGAGAALMAPATAAIVVGAFAPHERGRAMGVYSGVSMIFLALGPLVGGVLTAGVSWRAVFFVNLPIGVAMLAVARFTLPRSGSVRSGSIDAAGVPLLVGGLGALVLGLMQARAWGWESPAVLALLAAALVLLPAFVWWERRTADPLVDLSLLRRGALAVDAGVLACVQFALVGVSVFGAIWVQDVLGFDAMQAGLSLLPLTLTVLVTAPLAGRLYDRVGVRPLLVGGGALVAAALLSMAALLGERSFPLIVPGYVLMGCGLGLIVSPANTDAVSTAPVAQRGQASGVVQTVRQVGGTVGVAVLGAVVSHVQFASVAPDSPTAATEAVAAAYWVGGAVMVVTTVAAALVLRPRARWLGRPARAS